MPQYPNAAERMTDAHEDRIQRLEGSVQSLVSVTAGNSVKLDFMAEKMEVNQSQILEKLDGFSSSVDAQLRSGANQFEIHAAALAEHKAELAAIKKRAAETARRMGWLKKGLLGVVATIIGVLAHNFGDAAWAWLTR